MPSTRLVFPLLLLALAPACGGSGGGDLAAPSAVAGDFVHVVTPASRPGIDRTALDHALVNGMPEVIVHVAPNTRVAPPASGFPPAVAYESADAVWEIVNDTGPVDLGSAFNVLVRVPGPNDFVHTALPSNSAGSSTYVSHPLLDGDPAAIFLVTPRVSIVVGRVGVRFDDTAGRWAIYREDAASTMPQDAAFNVSIFDEDPTAWLHLVGSRGALSGYTELAHPLIDGNPDARIFSTHVQNPMGAPSGPYSDLPIASMFGVPGTLVSDPMLGRWVLQVTTAVPMPVGAGFNLVVR